MTDGAEERDLSPEMVEALGELGKAAAGVMRVALAEMQPQVHAEQILSLLRRRNCTLELRVSAPDNSVHVFATSDEWLQPIQVFNLVRLESQ